MPMQIVVIVLAWLGAAAVLLAVGIGVTELYDKLVVGRIRRETERSEAHVIGKQDGIWRTMDVLTKRIIDLENPAPSPKIDAVSQDEFEYWRCELTKLRQEVSDLRAARKEGAS